MKQKTRKVKHIKSEQLCKIHQQIARFAKNLDDLPNATDVQKDRLTSTPACMVPMVF